MDVRAASSYSDPVEGAFRHIRPVVFNPAHQRSILVTVLLAMILMTSCGYKSVQLQGNSMTPNFNDGQKLIVDGNAYASANPERGDVIVLTQGGRLRINRVIGLPNEKVAIRDGAVYIIDQTRLDGYKLNESYLAPNTVTSPASGQPDQSVYEVPADQYFVMGDNRGGSADSRNLGTIPKKDITGKVVQSIP